MKIKLRDGVEIYYKDWGTGQPIFFHHGWPLSGDDWDTQMMFFLERGYRVIAHDRRGHGRSTPTADGHDMDTYAADVAELTKALEAVGEGKKYFSKEINILDTNQDFRNTVTIEDKKVDEILSKREIEVLTLICKEYSNSEIAKKLFLSVSTVETHRKNLIAKLGVNNTVGLVKFALKNKLIE